MSRYLRQQGLVDQDKLSSLRILISGDVESLADLIVLLEQLGASKKNSGKVGILCDNPTRPTSIFWKLAFSKINTFTELCHYHPLRYELIDSNEIDILRWDVHLAFNSTFRHVKTIYGKNWGARAIVSTSPIPSSLDMTEISALTPFSRIMAGAALLELMIEQMGLKHKTQVSGSWLTITSRIETTNMEEASQHVKAKGGLPVSYHPTEDGLGILCRVRIPTPEGLDPFDFLQFEKHQSTQTLSQTTRDVGFLPWDSPKSNYEQIVHSDPSNFTILGAGGLGSWSIPLLVHSLNQGKITVVDSDLSIDEHNLNRQVLYNEKHLGMPKARVAVQRLQELNSCIEIEGFVEQLCLGHVKKHDDDIGAKIDDIELDDDESSPLVERLKEKSVYLGCLDNMRARSILNHIALRNQCVMVNGGTESTDGIVEIFGEQGCMVCRYGKETAHSIEVISCTEEGSRPISSIVTSSAWTGAMMAMFAFLSANSVAVSNFNRMLWSGGSSSSQSVLGKPPWYDEDCLCHI